MIGSCHGVAYFEVLFQHLIGGAEKCDENSEVVGIPVRECLLPLGAESFVFQFAIQKFKGQDI